MATTEYRTRGAEGRPVVSETSVPSFSREGVEYTVRLYDGGSTCTCPAYRKGHRNPCKHIRALVAPVYTVHRRFLYGRDCYEIRDSEGNFEGRVPSFADAYETVVEDFGGVLGEVGVGGYYGEAGAA